jgi:hypothetical protein
MGADLLHLYTAHLGSEEIKGLFFRSKDSYKTYSVLCNEEMNNAIEGATAGKPLIIFLDELNRASDVDCLNALFSMISKRGVPGLGFPDNVYLVAAGNPPTGNFAVAEMADDAYIRRLVWFGVKIDPGVWLKYAQGKPSFKIDVEANMEPPVRLPLHNSVISYIKTNPQRLFDKDLADQGKPHPNPASWDRVSDILKVLERAKEASMYNVKTLVAGLIGGTLASGLWEFYSDGDLQISPEDLIDQKWSVTMKKLDQLKEDSRHDLCSDLVSALCLHLTLEMPVLVDKGIKNIAEFIAWLTEDHQALFSKKLTLDESSPDFADWRAYKDKDLMPRLQKHEKFNELIGRLQELRFGAK